MQYSQNPTAFQVTSPNGTHEECIAHCLEAFRACSELIPHQLNLHGEATDSDHIRLLSGCAILCETAAKILMLDSNYQQKTCGLCAEVCLETARSCEDHADEDPMSLECARICRLCAKVCQGLAL